MAAKEYDKHLFEVIDRFYNLFNTATSLNLR